MNGELDYYKILQVDPSAEPEVIETVYKRLARKYHPDVNKADDANQRMQAINLAYEVLSDPRKRAEYDCLRARRAVPRPARAGKRYSTPSWRRTSPRYRGYEHEEAVRARPTLMAWPASLDFGSMSKGDSRSASVRIGITQGRTMNGKVLANQRWIKIGPLQRFDESSAIVQIGVDTTTLRDGMKHEGTVTVKSLAYGTLIVPVSVYVMAEPRPGLRVEPEVLDFGILWADQPPGSLELHLSNRGSGPLSGSLNVKSSWLRVSQVDFEGVEALTVRAIADVSGLKPGRSYTGRIDVLSSAGIVTVVAKVQVAEEVEPLPPPNSDDYWEALISRLVPRNRWERDFLDTITLQSRQRGWKPSPHQEAVIERLRRQS